MLNEIDAAADGDGVGIVTIGQNGLVHIKYDVYRI